MAKSKKKAGKKSGKKSEPVSAAEMKKLEQDAKATVEEPLEIPEVTRTIQEILNDRVTIAPGHIGLTMADDTPLEEHIAVLGYTTQLSDHVGFMIGDILNNGAVRWGSKYKVALDRTSKKLSTLKGYAEASRRIPLEKRVAALSFTAHREILRLPDEKMEKLLEDLEKQAEKKDGELPTTRELRVRVQHSMPRTRGKAKRVTSGKHGKGKKKVVELPAYEPTDAEKELLDEAEIAITEAGKMFKRDGKLFKIVVQLDNKTKQEWLSNLDNFVLFYNDLKNKTGY